MIGYKCEKECDNMKKILIINLVLLLVILVGCSSSTNNENDMPEKTFTIEELSEYEETEIRLIRIKFLSDMAN